MKVSFSNSKNDAATENNVKLPYAAPKRALSKIRWICILLIVGSPFIAFLGKIVLGWLFVTSPGTIWLEKKTINAIEAGTVEKVFYHRGDLASADTVLLRVKRKIPENRLEQLALLEAERDAGNAQTSDAIVSSVVNGRNIADERQLAQQNVAYYQQVRDETKWLMDQGAATRPELDAAENKLREAKSLLAASSAASAVDNVSSVSPVRMAQVEQSIKSLEKITEQYFDIKSSQGGKISSIFVSEGQSFAAGEPLAVVMNTEQVHVVTYIDPNDFKKIDIGKAVTVEILGSGRKIQAVVEKSPVVAETVPSGISNKFYPATMRGVQIFLKVIEPLTEEEIIEGLPVVVEW